MPPPKHILDPWARLRQHTAARIALGRAGGSLPTEEVLRFALDHAEARDAVHAEFDVDAVQSRIASLGFDVLVAHSQAADRNEYLTRPDLGRRLDNGSRNALQPVAASDVALIVGDGLSARATNAHAATLLEALVPLLRSEKLALGPIVLVRHARVAIQDEIGQLLRAKCALILIGERPGLGAADSLGAYVVFNPQPGNTDADRNCVSNIRPAGLPIRAAADTLHYLITQSLRRQISGVQLKDDRQGESYSINVTDIRAIGDSSTSGR